MIYLLVFIFTAFLLYLASRCKGVLEFLITFFALMLPCLLAGFRDETVGVDVLTYAKWMCIDAQSMPLLQFMEIESSIAAIGWNLFTWISVHLLGGLSGYLFAIELLCIVPVYLTLRHIAHGYEWLGILLWLLVEYAFTLNGMRQSAAMGFVFYSMIFLVEQRPISFVVCIFVAMLFHQTAVIGFLLYPFALAIVYGDGLRVFLGKWRGFVVAIITITLIAVVFALGPKLVVLASVLKGSYSYQVNHLGGRDISTAAFYLLGSISLLWFLTKKDFVNTSRIMTDSTASSRISDQKSLYVFLCAIIIIGCLLCQLNYVANTLGRFGYYGTMFISLWGGVLAQNKNVSRSAVICLVILMTVYFVAMTLVLGTEGVYPYTSQIITFYFP